MTEERQVEVWEECLLEWMKWGMSATALYDALSAETRRRVFDDGRENIMAYLRTDCPQMCSRMERAAATRRTGAGTASTVLEMVKGYLRAGGFDGLCDGDCGCALDDLASCNNGCPPGECQAAYAWEMADGTTWYAAERPDGAIGRKPDGASGRKPDGASGRKKEE